MSSTGEGEMPENGETFMRFLRRCLSNDKEEENKGMFSHVWLTMLGLGDTNYSKYQGAPIFIWNGLTKLGAHPFYVRGEADEATSLELGVEPWLEGLPEEVIKVLDELKSKTIDDVAVKRVVKEEDAKQEDDTASSHIELIGKITERKELYTKDGKDIFEVKIEFGESIPEKLAAPGSTFHIYPENREEDVQLIAKAFCLDLN